MVSRVLKTKDEYFPGNRFKSGKNKWVRTIRRTWITKPVQSKSAITNELERTLQPQKTLGVQHLRKAVINLINGDSSGQLNT